MPLDTLDISKGCEFKWIRGRVKGGNGKTILFYSFPCRGEGLLKHEVVLNEKQIDVNLSHSAIKQLSSASRPVLIEVELYFSCLIKKVCHFSEPENATDYAKVVDGLYINFRATMTNKCAIDDFDKDKTADFPIVNQQPYIPRWVNLDYSSKGWSGDFGYAM